MKKVIFIFFTCLGNYSFAQSLTNYDSIKLEQRSDYRTADSFALEASNYLLSTWNRKIPNPKFGLAQTRQYNEDNHGDKMEHQGKVFCLFPPDYRQHKFIISPVILNVFCSVEIVGAYAKQVTL